MSNRLPLCMTDFCLVRSCALPFEALVTELGAVANNRVVLKQWLDDPFTVNALSVASGSLLGQIHYWQEDHHSTKAKKIEKTLLKYYMRMTSRPTPFGLFAGVSLASMSDNENQLNFNAEKQFRRHTRFDYELLFDIKHRLAKKYWLTHDLCCQLNPTAYRTDNQYRFIRGYQRCGDWHYQLTNLKNTPFLTEVVRLVKTGISAKELLTNLQHRFDDLNMAVLEGDLKHLVDIQFILPCLPLPVTARDPQDHFLNQLSENGFEFDFKRLDKIRDQCKQLDDKPLLGANDYYRLNQSIANEFNASHCLQVDMVNDSGQLNINKNITDEFLNDLWLLHQLSEKNPNPFRRIINTLKKKADGRLYPLKAVLDDELGWSFSSIESDIPDLLEGMAFDNGQSIRTQPGRITPRLKKLDHFLITLLEEMVEPFQQEIVLDKERTGELTKGQIPGLPAKFGAMVSMYQSSIDNPDSSPLIHLHSCHGPSPATLIGRFCHLDQELWQKTSDLLAREQVENIDVLLAEIVHLPHGRLGNISARPQLLEYEIPILGDAAADDDKIISLDDLYVYVEKYELKLWSKKHRKQVLPRLSSAHSHAHQSIGIYHFLAKLQLQNMQLPRFKWHPVFSNRNYLPRVRIGNTLLSKRQWYIPRTEFVALAKSVNLDYTSACTALRNKYQLPDWVSLCPSDTRLTLNLANSTMLAILLDETQEMKQVLLEEVLEYEFESLCRKEGKALSHEIILLIEDRGKKSKQAKPLITTAHLDASQGQHSFIIGSEWLSLKIYTGQSLAEDLLLEKLIPLINKLRSDVLFEQCFYLRYADPDFHLRIRFKGKPDCLLAKVLAPLSALIEPLLNEGLVKDLLVDTYQQEIERYGGIAGIGLAEAFFDANSSLCFTILQSVTEDKRFLAVLKVIDDLLAALGLSVVEKYGLISEWREKKSKICGDSREFRKASGRKYNTVKAEIANWLYDGKYVQKYPSLCESIGQHKVVFCDTLQQLKVLEIDQSLTRNIISIVETHIHMFSNRIFATHSLEHEYLVYELLRRHYEYLSCQHR